MEIQYHSFVVNAGNENKLTYPYPLFAITTYVKSSYFYNIRFLENGMIVYNY